MGIDTSSFDEGYTDIESLKLIRISLLQELKILKYITPFHNYYQIKVIQSALLKELRVSRLCDIEYSPEEMVGIVLALEKDVDLYDVELEQNNNGFLIEERVDERRQIEYERMKELGLIESKINQKTIKL